MQHWGWYCHIPGHIRILDLRWQLVHCRYSTNVEKQSIEHAIGLTSCQVASFYEVLTGSSTGFKHNADWLTRLQSIIWMSRPMSRVFMILKIAYRGHSRKILETGLDMEKLEALMIKSQMISAAAFNRHNQWSLMFLQFHKNLILIIIANMNLATLQWSPRN